MSEEAVVAKRVAKEAVKEKAEQPPPQQPSDQQVGAVESINAMLAELQEQNNGLRNRTVQLRGELAKAMAIIQARDATIRDLNALMVVKKN
jgi:hypothetical protein